MTKKECNILLFSITLCWASSYIFIKDLPADMSSYAYLTLTAGIAGVILIAVFHRSLLRLDRRTVLRGLVLAVLLAGNMLLEKAGLALIPSSSASFLSSLNIIMVPLILLFFRKLPTKNNVAGIVIILTGLFISSGVSFSGESSLGSLYMLGACGVMSLYTVISAEFTKKSDPLVLSVLQIAFSAVIGWVLWFIEDPATFGHIEWSRGMLSSIFILAFFSKAYAYIMLMYAEKYADAISVTIIAATEPVVTLTLALLIPAHGATETFSFRSLAGAAVIAGGAVVAGLNFLSPAKSPAPAEPDASAVPAEETPHLRGTGLVLRVKQFLLTMVPFAVLGAAFKVMVLVEGFTEVRPANAIPIVAGLLFGPIGGIGCAVGNLAADCFGTLNMTSLLGLVGNFAAAYIPYRMWYALSRHTPNVHTGKSLLLYAWCACVGALSCAMILGLGLELFFGLWIDTIYKYVLLNNLGFSLALGLPIFILMTSDSIRLPLWEPRETPFRIKRGRWSAAFLVLETVLLAAAMAGVWQGYHLANSMVFCILSAAAGMGLLGICLLPTTREETLVCTTTTDLKKP